MPSSALFKSEIENLKLAEEGYTVVPFLNQKEIESLKSFFFQHHPKLPEGMYASSHALDFNFRKKMNVAIQSFCARAMNDTFDKISALGATFMAKSKGENGKILPHQDWSIVNEDDFFSYNIWLPLVDTNAENGTLQILPKSHLLLNNIRGLNIPSSYQNVIDETWQYLQPISVKAGEALVYDHRLLHASSINQTDTPRLVIVYGIVPLSAQMLYYFGRKNEIEVYACSPEYYFNADIGKEPDGLTLIKKIENQNPLVTAKQLKKIYATNPTLSKKIASFFFARFKNKN